MGDTRVAITLVGIVFASGAFYALTHFRLNFLERRLTKIIDNDLAHIAESLNKIKGKLGINGD